LIARRPEAEFNRRILATERRHFTVKQNTRSWSAGYAKQLSANTIVPRVMRAPARFRRKLSRFIRPAIMRNRIRYVHARKSVRLQLVTLIARGKSRERFVPAKKRGTKYSLHSSIIEDISSRCYGDTGEVRRHFPVSPLFSCVFLNDKAVNRLKRKFSC